MMQEPPPARQPGRTTASSHEAGTTKTRTTMIGCGYSYIQECRRSIPRREVYHHHLIVVPLVPHHALVKSEGAIEDDQHPSIRPYRRRLHPPDDTSLGPFRPPVCKAT